MIGEVLQGLIIVVILAGLVVAIRRGGAANPESTGQLGSRMAKLKTQVTGLEGTVSSLQEKLNSIDAKVEEIERSGATADDVQRIEKALGTQGEYLKRLDDGQSEIREMAAHRAATLGEIKEQIGRLYDVLIPRGLK